MGTPDAPVARLDVTVVVPVYNEAESLARLLGEITAAMAAAPERSYEVLFVDDGSKDGSAKILDGLAAGDPRVRVLHFRTNCGQTAAIGAGLDHARGRVIVPMDADLQNDAADVPLLLARLDEGHDVVSGWRRDRHDSFTRVIPSRIANALISRISGVRLHDYGCTLKAYRRDVMEGVRLYGEMHRFIPIYASWQGARVTEMPVRHRARSHGRSNYGFGRTWRVVLDLLVVKFLASYSTKPIHVFGGFGLACFGFAFLSGLAAVWLKYFGDPPRTFIQTPLPLLTVLLIVLGFLSILMGLLAELVIRTYYEARGLRPYSIASDVGAGAAPRSA